MYPGLSPGNYWAMGIIGMLGLFTSVVLHELGHSIIARRLDLEIRGITLFIFGGVAEMASEPQSAKVEFLVAIGGPLVSLLLAVVFWGLYGLDLPPAMEGILLYLASINTLLLAFNMIPAFPLDGGRVLRAVLWGYGKSLRRATRICSRIGAAFGWAMIAMGILQLFAGFLVSAIWWGLLGLFLKGAAGGAYQQLLLRRMLEGEPVRNFMAPDPVSVPADTSIRDVVEKYVYHYHYKTYPVTDRSGNLLGSVSTSRIKGLPREEWESTTAEEIAEQALPENTIRPGDDAMKALSIMSRQGKSRLLVVDGGKLEGILSLKDLMQFFALKVELEEA
jgi:Zn-dependent protease/CBS domain-containing protein